MRKWHPSWLWVGIYAFSLSSCWLDMDFFGSSGSSGGVPQSRQFNAQKVINPKEWYTLQANLRYQGSRCYVYVDQKESGKIPDKVINDIGETFDNKVYPRITQYFGDFYDADGNGKVVLLLLDIQDGYTGPNSAYVAGYFDETHMYSRRTYSTSNEADMLFLDTYPGLLNQQGTVDQNALSDLKLTMAHEYQHLVNFSERVAKPVSGGQSPSRMDTWINEGLSAAAEYIFLDRHVDWKVQYFNHNQYQESVYGNYTPSSDKNLWGQYFLSWDVGTRWGDPLVNYSTVYLFFQWLRIQATSSDTEEGTPAIYKDILQSPYPDYRSVVEALHTRTGGPSWSGAWKDVFRTWLLANLLNRPSGPYGYKHKLTAGNGQIVYLYPRFFTALSTAVNRIYVPGYPPFSDPGGSEGKAYLVPGDAVYVKLPEPKDLTDGNVIVYGASDLSGQAPKLGTGTYVAGEVLVAVNGKGLQDDYVYGTGALLTPGNSTSVGISTLTPPSGSLVPKGGRGGTETHRTRPFPIDALLGPAEKGREEALLPRGVGESR